MSWGMNKYTIIQRIDEIEKCLDKEMWQSALALSLTIPDICGQIEFPYMYGKNGEKVKSKVGYRYKNWFRKHVENRFADHHGFNDDGSAIHSYFNAEMCYALRNAFLHAGSDEIEDPTIYRFKLELHGCDSYGTTIVSNEDSEFKHVTVDMSSLCNNICASARKFYEEWSDKEDFENKRCEWLDIKEWSRCYHNMNNYHKE